AAPVARVRDPRLDFFRGMAMFIILIAHTPGNWFTLWIPARFGFSDATEMFVFCSGMASALAFGAVFRDRGWVLGTARVGFRCWQVYWAHIGLFAAIAATMAALNATELFERDYVGQLNLHPFFNNTLRDLPALMTLTYVPNYFDILPMYLVILAMMPIVVVLAQRSLALAAVFVLILWFLAQHGVHEALGLGTFDLHLPAEPWSDREWFFNPFGWQLVFFTGFALMAGWLPKPPVHPALIAIAIAIVLASFLLSHISIRAINREWFGLAFDGNPVIRTRLEIREWITKTDFGLFRYLHCLALAYLAWVLVGPNGRNLTAPSEDSLAGRAWHSLLAIILKVGQQSLAVFVMSMFLARLMGVAFDVIGRTAATMVLVNFAGAAILVATAYSVGWFKSQPWRARKDPAHAKG
ncbi:MAG: OpgC domain-containing protein, partial [Pseudomonadota bacterium]